MELIIAVAICVILYTVLHRIYRRMWDEGLDVDIRFEGDSITAGEESAIVETVTNDKWLPLTSLHIKFATSNSFAFRRMENATVTDRYHRNDAFFVMGHTQVVRTHPFTGTRRGLYTIDGVSVVARDFFMTKTYAATVANSSYIYVLPKKLATTPADVMFNGILGEIVSKKSLLEDALSFRGIRDYTTADAYRSINWKATARHGDLLVNMYDPTAEQRVKILLNLEPHVMMKTSFMTDHLIELASTMAEALIHKGIPVSICSNGVDTLTGDVDRVGFSSSKDHMLVIDKYLARIKGNAGIDSFYELLSDTNEPATTYIVVSAYHKIELLEKLDALAKTKDVYMITPYIDEGGLEHERPYMRTEELKLKDL